jgi:hypothetical protein
MVGTYPGCRATQGATVRFRGYTDAEEGADSWRRWRKQGRGGGHIQSADRIFCWCMINYSRKNHMKHWKDMDNENYWAFAAELSDLVNLTWFTREVFCYIACLPLTQILYDRIFFKKEVI